MYLHFTHWATIILLLSPPPPCYSLCCQSDAALVGEVEGWPQHHLASVPGRMDVSMRRGVSIRLLTHEESQSGTSLPSTGQRVTHSDSFLVGLRAGLMKKKGCGRGAGCKPYPLPVCCSSVHTGLFPTYTHRDRKVTAHSTLTHLLWRKNHFQNVTWLLKGSVSNGISGARRIRGKQLLSVCPNLEHSASH